MPRAKLVILKLGSAAIVTFSAALSACGNSPATPDSHAATVDAKAIDAVPPPDATPAPVTITAFADDGTPAVGLAVAFLNADDSVVLETVTDSNGSASASMAAGGSVTLGAALTVAPTGQTSKPQVFTFLAVKPGDNLVVGSAAPAAAMKQLTIDVPSSDNADSNGVFALGTSCGETPVHVNVANAKNTPITISIPSSCTTADLYIVAIDQNGAPTAGAFIAQQVIPASGPLTITATFAAMHSVAMSLNDVPGWTSNVLLELVPVDGNAELFSSTQNSPDNGNNTFQTTLPLVDSSTLQLVSIVSNFEQDGVGQVLIQRYSSDADEPIELGNGWLPSIEAQANYNTPTTGVIWTESGSAGPANVAYNKMNL